MKSSKIYNLLNESKDGMKCSEIVKITGWGQNSVSGILSMLKGQKKVVNEAGVWRVASTYGISELDIINRLRDVTDGSLNNSWSEGYLSALVDHGIIDENEFEKLLDYVRVN